MKGKYKHNFAALLFALPLMQGLLMGFRNDNVHPNPQGYEIWATAVADTLKGWTK